MTLPTHDLRLALRGLGRSPLFAVGRDPVAGPRHRRQHRDLHADRPDPAAQAAGEETPRAGDALPAGAAHRQQHGHRACTRIRSTRITRSAPSRCAEVICRAAWSDLGQRRQPDRAASTPRWCRATSSPCSAWRRPLGRVFNSQEDDQVYQGHPGRGARATTTGTGASTATRASIGKKILVNNYPMTIVGVSAAGLRRHRSGALAADARADPDEAGDRARVDVGEDGRRAHPVGAGVRAAEARLHHRDRRRRRCRGCSRRSASTRLTLPGAKDCHAVHPRAVHEGPAARRQGRRRLLAAPQRLLDARSSC